MPEDIKTKIPILSQLFASGKKPDYLLWIGCAGSFDERYKKVIHSLVRVLNLANIDFDSNSLVIFYFSNINKFRGI